jgi:hypothetical protein
MVLGERNFSRISASGAGTPNLEVISSSNREKGVRVVT